MLTAAECQANANKKLAEAPRDDRHRKRLNTAAEAWLSLAARLKEAEALSPPIEPKKKKKKKRVSRNLPM
jgi:hypothetical protein